MVRQLHGFSPAELLLVERCEYALYEIHREMRARDKTARLVPVVADVGDPLRMEEVFARHRPHVVIHAAAYKHVPLMEANVSAAIRNNVLGTRCLAEAAGRHGVEVFVMISTDKAVNPTSVMGASKRLAELAVQELDARHPATRYVAVRFGNVLGSTGSVIPLFREQIQRGGPVTVTHPDMQRYFMTIPEAAQLVLQAAAMGQGGEIFVLDMGQPVRIADLARDMIRLSGLRPDVDIRIEYTGLRPGEKMFEELHTDGEQVERTRHPMIFIGRIQRYAPDQIETMLRDLEGLALAGDVAGLRQLLNRVLPEAQIAEDQPVDSGTS
jgi:FlaA1/EpsC-like NDP-sugar epimerase